MRYLLDTNVLLWYLEGRRDKLSKEIVDLIDNPKNIVYSSVVNYWEISIKNKIGKLNLKITLNKLVKNKFEKIEVKMNHVLANHKLKNIHNDPFDRILISQAQSENLTIITSDKKFKKYKVKLLLIQ